MAQIRVCAESEIPVGGCKVVQEGVTRVAVFRLKDGFFAISDVCTHDHAYLSEGNLVDERTVECPWHGAQFDVSSGRVMCMPATEDVKTYKTEIRDGSVFVDVSE